MVAIKKLIKMVTETGYDYSSLLKTALEAEKEAVASEKAISGLKLLSEGLATELEDFRQKYKALEAKNPLISNADRIRAMTDEELALELEAIANWDRKNLAKVSGTGFFLDWCKKDRER